MTVWTIPGGRPAGSWLSPLGSGFAASSQAGPVHAPGASSAPGTVPGAPGGEDGLQSGTRGNGTNQTLSRRLRTDWTDGALPARRQRGAGMKNPGTSLSPGSREQEVPSGAANPAVLSEQQVDGQTLPGRGQGLWVLGRSVC